MARRTVIAALSVALVVSGAAAATAATDRSSSVVSDTKRQDSSLSRDFGALTRSTGWQLTGKLRLNFPTYHTEGLAMAGDRIFLSAVQILEPTKPYPTPQGGFDRSPGRGIGHVFVMDTRGNLQRDIILGEGDMYHPGGLDSDGTSVWVPVAQYRPGSTAIIYTIDIKTLAVHQQFRVGDHIGGIVRDQVTGDLVGNNWGSRGFYKWTSRGKEIDKWQNTSHFIDYQDCQYVPSRKMICGGVTNLPQTTTAGGTTAVYELGGMGLIDLRSHEILHEVPFQQWSTAGHAVTRNPLKLAANGDRITMWAAPDNGDEGNGTELLTYQAGQ